MRKWDDLDDLRKTGCSESVIAPGGVSAAYGISGRSYMVGADRTIKATPNDAAHLMAAGWQRQNVPNDR